MNTAIGVTTDRKQDIDNILLAESEVINCFNDRRRKYFNDESRLKAKQAAVNRYKQKNREKILAYYRNYYARKKTEVDGLRKQVEEMKQMIVNQFPIACH